MALVKPLHIEVFSHAYQHFFIRNYTFGLQMMSYTFLKGKNINLGYNRSVELAKSLHILCALMNDNVPGL
jgi:hypothetical protein